MSIKRPSVRPGKLLEKMTGAAVILWIGFIFSRYFSLRSLSDLSFISTAFSHPELMNGNKFLVNSLESLKVLCCSAMAIFTLWRWGRRMLHWLGLGLGNIPLRFCMEMALGILLFNALWLGLGLEGLWFQPLLLILFFSSLVWSLWDFRGNFLKFQKMPKGEWPGWLFVGLAGLGLFFLGASIAQGLLPEIYFDGLVYHLSTLSFWRFHHGITDFDTNLYSYYPFGAELYFLNGFMLRGSEAAKTLNVFTSALCALAAAGWAAEEAGVEAGCLAWALVLFFPWSSATVWTTQNDVFLAFFFILFYYALFRWSRERGRPWAFAAGILGGAVLTVKYTAGIGVAAGFLALALTRREMVFKKRWMDWGLLLSVMGLSLAPWLLKNEAFTGNGFYPYFSSWLGGKTLSPEKLSELMNDHQAALPEGYSWVDWFKRILVRDLDKTIAPILFSFLPFLFLPGRRRSVTQYLGVLSGVLLVSGFLVSHQLRLMIPAFLICFLMFVLNLADLKQKRWTQIGSWALLVFGILNLLSLGRLSVDYYRGEQVWLGQQTRTEYLSGAPQTGSYFDLTQASANLPEKDQILVVGDARSLYYPRSFYANSVFDDQVLEVLARKEKDGDGIARGLRERGIDDLAVSGKEGMRLAGQYSYYRLNAAEWNKLDEFIQRHTELIYSKELNGIYRIHAGPPKRQGKVLNLLEAIRNDK